MTDNVLEVPLGDGYLHLTVEEVKSLYTGLVVSPALPSLIRLMEGLKQASDMALRNPAATIDVLRVHQGRIQALIDLASVLSEDVPEWWKRAATHKEK